LNAGASLMRAAPVCRPPELGRARPRVPLEGHALSPKPTTRSKLSNFRPQEPLRSPTELKPYIFREPPRGSSNHYLTLRLKARSSHACVQPPKNFCPHMARKVAFTTSRTGARGRPYKKRGGGTHDCRRSPLRAFPSSTRLSASKVDLVHHPLHVGRVESPCMHFVYSRPPLSSVSVYCL
jgi:hypothetical protein